MNFSNSCGSTRWKAFLADRSTEATAILSAGRFSDLWARPRMGRDYCELKSMEICSLVFHVLTMLRFAVCVSVSLLFAVLRCFRFPSPTPMFQCVIPFACCLRAICCSLGNCLRRNFPQSFVNRITIVHRDGDVSVSHGALLHRQFLLPGLFTTGKDRPDSGDCSKGTHSRQRKRKRCNCPELRFLRCSVPSWFRSSIPTEVSDGVVNRRSTN